MSERVTFTTSKLAPCYVAEAPCGSGMIVLNDAAARLAMPGDPIIVIAYTLFNEADDERFPLRIVPVEPDNRMLCG
nr:aspartate 1-decarboxylase [Bradyrhizobium sp. CW9]